MNIKQVAQVAHQTNKAYCATIQDFSQPMWADTPEWQRASAVNGVEYHLKVLRSGAEPSPSASHENWLKEKTEAGWVYGPAKDPAKKEHPCCVPYAQLPLEQKMKDYLFGAVVKAFYEAEPGA